MKKIIINNLEWTIIFSIILGIFLGYFMYHKHIPEDVNNDGKVNSQDLFLVKKYLIEKGE